MLLHAATIARHDVIVFKQAIATQAALAAQSLDDSGICHEAIPSQDDGKAQGLPSKSPGDAANPCPICLGLTSAHAMAASAVPVLRVPQAFIALAFAPHDRQSARPAGFRLPPNRGPPSYA
jgi:hypothetical protein